MFDKQKILNNVFKPEEKIIFSKALDKAYFCIKRHEPSFTDFLDPYKISEILRIIGNRSDFKTVVFGGIDGCERQKIGFFPEFYNEEDFVFPIDAIEITYNSKYSKKLAHRDFLGAMIGLGITREKIGDIIIENESAYVFIDSDIVDFVCFNLEKAGNVKVKVKSVGIDNIVLSESKNNIRNITVSSLRLDVVLSGAFNLSRSKVSELIKAEKAFVNWALAETGSIQVRVGDTVTLRGAGRIRINEILGKTKKDRLLISILTFG